MSCRYNGSQRAVIRGLLVYWPPVYNDRQYTYVTVSHVLKLQLHVASMYVYNASVVAIQFDIKGDCGGHLEAVANNRLSEMKTQKKIYLILLLIYFANTLAQDVAADRGSISPTFFGCF